MNMNFVINQHQIGTNMTSNTTTTIITTSMNNILLLKTTMLPPITLASCQSSGEMHEKMASKIFFAFLYVTVCLTSLAGNSLVLYVVATNKAMQTVTNLFITNLAVSDLVVNLTSLWVTPLYTYLGHWIWGATLCHAVPLFQGTSIFISSLTLTAIAVDRYTVILNPFQSRMSRSVCCTVILFIWLVSLMLVAPYAVHMKLEYRPLCRIHICYEVWAYEQIQIVYGFVVLALQFGLPFLVISFCYARIWHDMIIRQRRLGRRSDAEIKRKRRMLKMLIAMVVVFLLCWLPPNVLNIMKDSGLSHTNAFVFLFLLAHVISMTSSMWNPFLYGFLNDNFRREFMAVLPCFGSNRGRIRRPYSFSKAQGGNVANNNNNNNNNNATNNTTIILMNNNNNSNVEKASNKNSTEMNVLNSAEFLPLTTGQENNNNESLSLQNIKSSSSLVNSPKTSAGNSTTKSTLVEESVVDKSCNKSGSRQGVSNGKNEKRRHRNITAKLINDRRQNAAAAAARFVHNDLPHYQNDDVSKLKSTKSSKTKKNNENSLGRNNIDNTNFKGRHVETWTKNGSSSSSCYGRVVTAFDSHL